ncbi:CRISPR-associated endonuclease Cas3'' [Falsihalocynthiibacter arcticus]|uniref:CRISPR-associated protein Cas3 n=1 Tax=Falsihalocynthiibacter arcticus TaxID=1579316 RepID=A0A126V0X0_9RHOB|nr:CRISPR-associated endonuclease Cas3'' [Falsihalocynthiibacter arcticus]AML51934.1 CRISPR-associated protein Cas3 [Falsihalocynthiibacter arcticus]
MGKNYAHSVKDRSEEQWQSLVDHLTQVAELTTFRASPLGLKQAAYAAGLYHDLGKYDPAFQRKLRGEQNRVDHSTAGASVLMASTLSQEAIPREMIAYAILGHHAGLPDRNTSAPSSMGRRLEGYADALHAGWRDDVPQTLPGLSNELMSLLESGRSNENTGAFDISVATRMLFSCLVDADYRDTEAFYAEFDGAKDREWPLLAQVLPQMITQFDTHMDQFQPTGEINALRRDILSHVRRGAGMAPGVFTLTVPTGGGKTLASLGFALDHASLHGHRRIIYAIPFTSIIDQTAAVFRDIFGQQNILEHHSAIEADKNHEGRDKLRLAMEDWAAPVVVTTNVQLFESLFAARPGRARKLHNIAGSVIILDEAQTIPRPLLLPCLAMLDSLARVFGCSIVLCTATQPAVGETLKGGLALAGRELAPDPSGLARRLKRVEIGHGGIMDNTALVSALRGVDQGLVVVNSRAHALDLWREATGLEGLFHLSTRQYAAHRRRILAQIRQRLAQGLPCRVISTSLIEAGVDVSFPMAWRAEAGLDQIVQVAGRVNRNGELLPALGQVTVFTPDGYAPPAEIAGLIGDMARMRAEVEDLQSPEAIQRYFEEVYWRVDAGLDAKGICKSFSLLGNSTNFNFRTVAEQFRMIESGMVPVIIPRDEEAIKAVAQLHEPQISSGQIARILQTHLVTVPPKARERMRACGKGDFVRPDLRADQFFVLGPELDLYAEQTGLLWEDSEYLDLSQSIL